MFCNPVQARQPVHALQMDAIEDTTSHNVDGRCSRIVRAASLEHRRMLIREW